MTKASSEQLRQVFREERHAWRLFEAELRTKLVDSDEFCGHEFENLTGGERAPADEEGEEMDEEGIPATVANQLSTPAVDDGFLERVRLLTVIGL